jgi:hypothetical protein
LTARRALPALGVGAWLAVACGNADEPETRSGVRDSAGITIVDNAGGSDSTVFPVRETLRIGVADGDRVYQFNGITSIAVDSADTLYVAEQGGEGGSLGVRVYDPRGRFIRTFVRQGEGPGELRLIGRVRLFGDTVTVSGARRESVTLLFTRAGEPIGMLSDRVPPFWSVLRLAKLPHGSLAYISRRYLPDPFVPGGFFIDTTEFVVLDSTNSPVGAPPHRFLRRRFVPVFTDPSGRVVRERELIGRLLEVRRAREVTGATEGWAVDRGGITLGFEPAMPAAIDGRGWLHLARQEYVIDVFDATGRQVHRISRAHEPVRVIDADIDSLRMSVRRRYTSTGRDREVGERQLALFDAEVGGRQATHFPAIGAMLVGRDGSLWVRRADVPSELPRARTTEPDLATPNRVQPSHWDRFDASGLFVGAVRLPGGFAAATAKIDTITGVVKDELGVEYVVTYRVEGS